MADKVPGWHFKKLVTPFNPPNPRDNTVFPSNLWMRKTEAQRHKLICLK